MHIPRAWIKVSADGRTPDGRTLPVSVWGWGDDQSSARQGAAGRLQRVLERIGRGDPFPERYSYGSRPLREEVLGTVLGATSAAPAAVLTRNSYGAEVLNAARLLFLDIDLEDEPSGVVRSLRRMFGGASPDAAALARLRDALLAHGQATFRIYRTRSGFRVMAVDRDFDPTSDEAQALMRATGTDPAFSRLCQVQRSFRARLTPKPWRCHVPLPPGQHPRDGDRRFTAWLDEYERASQRYATCRYLETVGGGRPTGEARRLVELHDRTTRSDEELPLA